MTVIPMPYATTPMDPTFVAVVVDIREMVEAAMMSTNAKMVKTLAMLMRIAPTPREVMCANANKVLMVMVRLAEILMNARIRMHVTPMRNV